MPRTIVYWDANAFLGLLNGEPDKVPPCEDVWAAGEEGRLVIVTSTLTVAEVIYAKGASKLDPAKRPLVNNFFRAGHIVQKPLTRVIAEMARDVVWDSNIRPKDAVHIATAAFFKVPEFHTFDGPLLDRGTAVIDGFTIYTKKPHASRQLGIFDNAEEAGQ